jgi:hypothetical protein
MASTNCNPCSSSGVFEYTKQPAEKEIIGVDFSRRVPAGVTIVAVAPGVTYVSVEATESLSTGASPSDYASHLVLDTPVLTGTAGRERILAVMISEGVAEFKYKLSFKVTLSDSQVKEEDVWVIIREKN